MLTPEELAEARRFEHCQEYSWCRADRFIDGLLAHIDEQAAMIRSLEQKRKDELARYQAAIDEQAAEIKRLNAQREAEWAKWDGQVKSFQMMIDSIRKQAAYWRQKAIEERAKSLFLAKAVLDPVRVLSEPSPDEKATYQREAAREMESEASDHIAESGKMDRMTDERREAIENACIALRDIVLDSNDPMCWAPEIAILRGMLEEGK